MRLRVIQDGPGTGPVNMRRDGDLLAAQRPGDDPVLRLYRWRPAALSIGYNQSPDDFDLDRLTAAGYDHVQRPTGGRAILHADELTYAVVGASPGPLFGDSLHTAYMRVNRALVTFLAGLGLTVEISTGESRDSARGLVCFKSAGRHEISVAGRKLVGSAQRRTRGVFLQHGSILTGPRHLELPRFLKPGTRGSELTSEQLAAMTTDLGQELGRELGEDDLDALSRELAAAFAREFGLEMTT